MEIKEESKSGQDSPEKLAEVSSKSEEITIGGRRISRLGDRLIAVILDTFLMGTAFAAIGMFGLQVGWCYREGVLDGGKTCHYHYRPYYYFRVSILLDL